MLDNTMTLNEYQTQASKYRVEASPPEERIMGILEEAGEVAGVFKRLLRGDYTPDVAVTKLHKELGDVLWYLSAIAQDNGWTLEEVAQENLSKLESRHVRGLIIGTGSDR